MRQDHLIFLALVIAAAVVLGTTFGIVNAYKDIKTLPEVRTLPAHKSPAQDKSSDQKTQTQASPRETTSLAILVTGDEMDSSSSMILTMTETAELREMLNELGYDATNITGAIQTFQKNNGIQKSGQLDQVTIDKMIKQVTLKKVKTLAR